MLDSDFENGPANAQYDVKLTTCCQQPLLQLADNTCTHTHTYN